MGPSESLRAAQRRLWPAALRQVPRGERGEGEGVIHAVQGGVRDLWKKRREIYDLKEDLERCDEIVNC